MEPIFDSKSGVKLRKNLIEITISRSPKTGLSLHRMCEIVDLHTNDMLTFTHGAKEITIITEDKYEKAIIKVFEKESLVKRIDNLASITITLPEQAYEVRGAFYQATKALHDESINIVEIVSTLTELMIIVAQEDAEKAYKAIENMIKSK